MTNFKFKHSIIYILSLTLLLSGCTLPTLTKKEPTISDEEQGTALIISPSANVADAYYQGILPYSPSQTRGLLGGTTFDSNRFELGLLEIAPEYFSQGQFLFQEGQHLTIDEAKRWVGTKSDDNPDGLNSEKKFVHTIIEHNYMRKDKDNPALSGVVIGLAVSFDYKVFAEDADGNRYVKEIKRFTDEELDANTKELVSAIASRMRKKVDVPIVIAIYGFEQNSTTLPGRMLGVGKVDRGKSDIGEWSPFQERYIIFPSRVTGVDKDQETINQFNDFKDEVSTYFPDYTNVIGIGRLVDDKLKELTITVRADYDSKTEIVQLTQFIGAAAEGYFDKEAHINIYIESIERPQSIYVRPSNGKPYMHIYRN